MYGQWAGVKSVSIVGRLSTLRGVHFRCQDHVMKSRSSVLGCPSLEHLIVFIAIPLRAFQT